MKDVPDEVIAEIKQLCVDMAMVIHPITIKCEPNIVLAAMSWLHGSYIINLISDNPEELKKATLLYAELLINDIERVSGIKIWEKND